MYKASHFSKRYKLKQNKVNHALHVYGYLIHVRFVWRISVLQVVLYENSGCSNYNTENLLNNFYI